MWFSQHNFTEVEFEPVLQDGAPLRLYMWGKNLFTGGHFDAYIVDYYDYQPGSIDEDIFSVPDNCPKKLSPDLSPNFGKAHWHTKLRAMLPSRHYGVAQSFLPLQSCNVIKIAAPCLTQTQCHSLLSIAVPQSCWLRVAAWACSEKAQESFLFSNQHE